MALYFEGTTKTANIDQLDKSELYYHQKVAAGAIKEFKDKHPQFIKEEWLDIIQNGCYQDYCTICTALNYIIYYPDNITETDIIDLKNACNERAYNILGDMKEIVNKVYTIDESTLYFSEIYQVFAYIIPIPSLIKVLVRSVAIYYEYILCKKTMTINDIGRLYCLLDMPDYYLKGNGLTEDYYNLENKTFKQNYQKLMENYKKIRTFVFLLCDKKYKKAYDMILFKEEEKEDETGSNN